MNSEIPRNWTTQKKRKFLQICNLLTESEEIDNLNRVITNCENVFEIKTRSKIKKNPLIK